MKPNLIAHSLHRVALGKRPMVMLRGRLGGLVWYWVNGKQRVRKVGNMDGERWKHDPAFAGSRRASGVFGAAASLSGTLRWGLGAGCAFLGGRNLHTDITAAIQQACMGLLGKSGPARLAVRDWVPAVLGLPFFRPVLPFALGVETVRCPIGVHGPKVVVRVGSSMSLGKERASGSFFRFSVLGVWLSDGLVGEKGYRAVRPDMQGQMVRLVSEVVAADELDGWSWEVDLMELAGRNVPSGTGFAYCVGVEAVESADAVADWAGDWEGLLAEAERAAGISHLAEHSQTRRKFAARLRRELGDRFVGIVGGGLLVGEVVRGIRFVVRAPWYVECGRGDVRWDKVGGALVGFGAVSIDSS